MEVLNTFDWNIPVDLWIIEFDKINRWVLKGIMEAHDYVLDYTHKRNQWWVSKEFKKSKGHKIKFVHRMIAKKPIDFECISA